MVQRLGQRHEAIGDFCQEKGIFLVVDAVQQLGVTKIDTKECHFDLLVAGGTSG